MMEKKQNRFKRKITVPILTVLLFFAGHAFSFGQKVVLSGKVVAYENSLLRITKLTDVPREETFFVKVETVSKGKETAEFIKVKYRYFGEENALPKSLFEGKSSWKFVLNRNQECEQRVIENSAVSIVKIDENEDLPRDAVLPCYILVKEKLKAIK